MALGHGKTLISNFQFAGKSYNYIVVTQEEFTMLSSCLIEGEWNIENPTVLWTSSWVNYSNQTILPETYMNDTLASLNTFLRTQFGGQVPDTWIGKVEVLFRRCVVVVEGGVPQVRIQ